MKPSLLYLVQNRQEAGMTYYLQTYSLSTGATASDLAVAFLVLYVQLWTSQAEQGMLANRHLG